MGWKDSAVPVDQAPTGSWKDKATKVDAPPADESLMDKASGFLDREKQVLANMGTSAKVMVHGATNSALLGYMPQVEAGLEAGGQSVKDAATGDFSGAVNNFPQNYQTNKDRIMANEAALQKEAPVAYTLGGVGGALAVPIPGLNKIKAAKDAGMLAKTAIGATKGGLIGLLANPGDKEGESGDLQLDQRLNNAKWGMGLGAGADALAAGIEKAPESVDSIRRWMAAKQLGANTSQLRKLLVERGDGTKLDQLEQYMDKNGMLDMGTTYSGVVDKSGKMMDENGQKIGGIYQGVQDSLDSLHPDTQVKLADTALHGPDLAQEFLAQEQARLQKTHGGANVLKQIESEIGNPDNPVGLTALGPNATLPEVHNYRVSVDDAIPWNATNSDKAIAGSRKRLRQFLNEKLQDRVGALDEAAGENNLPELLDANKNYSDAATTNQIAEQTKAREMAKFVPGLVGMIGGGGVGVYSHEHGDNMAVSALKGLGAGLALRGARAVAPAVTYRGATALEPVLQQAGQYMERNPIAAPQALTVPWLQMMQENKKKDGKDY